LEIRRFCLPLPMISPGCLGGQLTRDIRPLRLPTFTVTAIIALSSLFIIIFKISHNPLHDTPQLQPV